MMLTDRYSGPPTPTVVDSFRRRVARTGYPVAETIRLGTPMPRLLLRLYRGVARATPPPSAQDQDEKERHVRMKPLFDDWARGGSTHWGGCWKAHLICALERAVDMLDDCLESMNADSRAGFEGEREFVQYMRENR